MTKGTEKPKFIVTYLCNKCGFDFAITEKDKPKCFYCDSTSKHTEISRRELSLESIVERLKLVNDRLEKNLKEAYAERPQDLPAVGGEDGELILIKALSGVKSLKEKTNSLIVKHTKLGK